MSVQGAVAALFVAFGAQRNTEQAALYVTELARSSTCGECAELAVRNLMRASKRLPPIVDLLAECREVAFSDAHTPHITSPQLAPRAETWWRTDAVKLIAPHCGGDRVLAAFIAAAMWWAKVPATHDAVAAEAAEPIWVASPRDFSAGKDLPALVEAAFRRARWAAEHHADDEMPTPLLQLEVSA